MESLWTPSEIRLCECPPIIARLIHACPLHYQEVTRKGIVASNEFPSRPHPLVQANHPRKRLSSRLLNEQLVHPGWRTKESLQALRANHRSYHHLSTDYRGISTTVPLGLNTRTQWGSATTWLCPLYRAKSPNHRWQSPHISLDTVMGWFGFIAAICLSACEALNRPATPWSKAPAGVSLCPIRCESAMTSLVASAELTYPEVFVHPLSDL